MQSQRKNLKIRMRQTLLSAVTTLVVSGALGSGVDVLASEAPKIQAEGAILADYETGQVLLAQNADEKMGIASMTKMITEYIVLEEISQGNINWDDPVVIGEYPYTISEDFNLSNVYLTEGESYSVRDLFEAMAIYSANGATIALAEHIAGSEAQFVERMQSLLESFGIEDAEIYNASGLNNSHLYGYHVPGTPPDAENKLSARDMAIVAFRLLNDHPEVLETSSVPKKYFAEGTGDEMLMVNWNWMLPGLSYEREGVDGLKTGTTDFAGPTFTSTAKEGDRRLVSVILNAAGGDLENLGPRFIETDRMLDYGFSEWQKQTLVESGQSFQGYETLPIAEGQKEEIAVSAGEQLDFLLQEDSKADLISYDVSLNEELLDEEGKLRAPVSKGTVVGRVTPRYGAESMGYISTDEKDRGVPLVASETVASANVFQRFGEYMSDLWQYFISRF